MDTNGHETIDRKMEDKKMGQGRGGAIVHEICEIMRKW